MPQLGMEPTPFALQCSPNLWNAREIPALVFIFRSLINLELNISCAVR